MFISAMDTIKKNDRKYIVKVQSFLIIGVYIDATLSRLTNAMRVSIMVGKSIQLLSTMLFHSGSYSFEFSSLIGFMVMSSNPMYAKMYSIIKIRRVVYMT